MKSKKGCRYCLNLDLPEWYVHKQLANKNPNIILLEPYIKFTSKIRCYCQEHKKEFISTTQQLFKGPGCYDCSIKKKSQSAFLSNQDVQTLARVKNPHITLMEYKGVYQSSIWRCEKHNKVFTKCFSTVRDCRSGCNECYMEYVRERDGMGQDEFESRLFQIHPELEVLERYTNNNSALKVHCTVHDHTFSATPVNLLKRISCCNKSFKTYKEEHMCQLIESWGFSIIRQKTFKDCVDKNVLPFDCYISGFNVLCEYDGEGHYYPVRFGTQSTESALEKFEYTKYHDSIKNSYCQQQNIPLIRVPYYKYDDLEYYLFDKFERLGLIKE